MKSIFRYLLTLVMFVSFGCSSDSIELEYELNSKLDEVNCVSSFDLSKAFATIDESLDTIQMHLTSQSSGDYFNFEASVEHYDTYHTIGMNYTTILEDGGYTLCLESSAIVSSAASNTRSDSGSDLCLSISIEGMKVSKVMLTSESADYYDLSGDGSEAHPFLINSAEDFKQFKYGLANDVTSAINLVFEQTASFDYPSASSSTEASFSCYNFAGTYNGAGYTISDIDYNGGSAAVSNIGLFSTLTNMAVVKDLNIEISYNNAYDNCGGLAGKVTGTVSVNNVFVKGNITNARNTIGGVLGYVQGANLNISNCAIDVSLDGANNIGGFIGVVGSSSVLEADNLSNTQVMEANSVSYLDNGLVYVYGTGVYVGGVVGMISDSQYNIKNVLLKSAINDNQKSVRVIHSASQYCGGAIGYVKSNSASSLENVLIFCPVYAEGNQAGGMIGSAHLTSTLTFTNCNYGSYVEGNECVGGYIGLVDNGKYLKFTGNNRMAEFDSGYLEVVGVNNVGGLIGSADGDISFDETVNANINVTASSTNAGGCIGIYNSGTLKCGGYAVNSNMSISGSATVGGIVGYLKSGANIEGSLTSSIQTLIDTKDVIPAKSEFTSQSNFAGTVTANNTYAGGIVGYMDGANSTLSKLVVTGTVSSSGDCGGIVGHIDSGSKIFDTVNCANMLYCNGATNGHIGGLVGMVNSYNEDISYCMNYADIKPANNDGAVGGMIGFITSINNSIGDNINNLINVGSVEGAGSVGGIIGQIDKTGSSIDLYELANYGAITSTSGDYTAGILGKSIVKYISITSCANHGKIYGNSCSYVGGIGGRLGEYGGTTIYSNVKVRYCCNKGEIGSGRSAANIGGLIGIVGESDVIDGQTWGIFDCYNSGAVTTNHDHDVGGLIGSLKDQCRVERCINTGKVSYGNGTIGTHDSGSIIYVYNLYFLSGTGKDWSGTEFSSGNRHNTSTFSNFDFNSTWAIDSNDSVNGGYPYLRSCKYQNISLSN